MPGKKQKEHHQPTQSQPSNEEITDAEDFSRIRETQITNVLRIIKRAIGRIKMSLILPKMAEDIDNVKRVLGDTSYRSAIPLVEKLKTLDVVKVQMLNHEVLKIVDYFQRHYQIYMKFPRLINCLSPDDKKLLVACETLYTVAERHLWRTAKNEINMERQLHTMYQENQNLKAKITHNKKKLKSKFAILRWKQATKLLLFEKQETDLAQKKWRNNVRIQNEIEKRSRTLRENHKSSVQRQKELEEELEKARHDYEQIIVMNAEQEKNSRAEKNKLLIQLQGILQKFDTNIGEKMCENLELEDQYKVAKKELDDFMVIYRKEEAVYKKIVVKYEQEEQKKQQQRILIFMMNRAARKIQKYWLKWRKDQQKKNRRLAKKSKKK